MSKLYVLNDGEITNFVEGTVCHEGGNEYTLYPDNGCFLLEGDRLFDPEQYMIYTVTEDVYRKPGENSSTLESCWDIPNDIEKQIFDFEHRDAPPLMDEAEDNVNHPAHYETGKFECIDVMLETQGKQAVTDFCVCNAFKYLYRHGRKNGVEDLKKARWYLDKAIGLIEGD